MWVVIAFLEIYLKIIHKLWWNLMLLYKMVMGKVLDIHCFNALLTLRQAGGKNITTSKMQKYYTPRAGFLSRG